MTDTTWQDEQGRRYSRECIYCEFKTKDEGDTQCGVCGRPLRTASDAEDARWFVPLVGGIILGIICFVFSAVALSKGETVWPFVLWAGWLPIVVLLRLIGCSAHNSKLQQRRAQAMAKARMQKEVI